MFVLLFVIILLLESHSSPNMDDSQVILLNTLPMAIFGILPMALVSDMATEDALKLVNSFCTLLWG